MNCKDCKYVKLLEASERSKLEYKEALRTALKKIGELQDKIKEMMSEAPTKS